MIWESFVGSASMLRAWGVGLVVVSPRLDKIR